MGLEPNRSPSSVSGASESVVVVSEDSTPEPGPETDTAQPETTTTGATGFDNDPRLVLTATWADSTLLGLEGLEPGEANIDLNATEIRWYSVWSIPGQDSALTAGIHWGVNTSAYAGILQHPLRPSSSP